MRPAQQLHFDLMKLVNLDRNEVVSISDRIQRRQREQPELTRRCTTNTALQIRRLLTIPATAWKNTEERWAKDAIKTIQEMNRMSGAEFDLALACYGVRRPGLDAALKKLEAGHAVQRKERQEPGQGQAEVSLHPVATTEIGDELDDETRAALAAVLAEAEQLKAKAAGAPSTLRNAAVNAED